MDLTLSINSWAGYAVLLFVLCVLTLIGYELKQDLREYLDKYLIDKLLHSNPRHLNSAAIHKIQKHINTRNAFQFAVIGDTQKSFVSFKKIIKKASDDNYDFIIHLGDFTSSGRYTQYKKMVQFIESVNIPVIFGVGNHDISNRGPECFAHFFGPLNFFYDIGAYRFIFINNNKKEFIPDLFELPGSVIQYRRQRGMEVEQINYLELLIQGNEYNFIFIHTPPDFPQFKHHSFTRNSERFINLMKHNATIISGVFSGHIHGYAELRSDGVQYIVSGGAGKKLHALREGITNKFNYVLMRVEGEKATHQVKFID